MASPRMFMGASDKWLRGITLWRMKRSASRATGVMSSPLALN
ncbi:hypothetical protein A2U01_0047656, partial [Trifolium medium]|nr:hypothetical protein [Trifolium medium]